MSDDFDSEPENFEIKLWPISKQNRYVEIRNPDYFSNVVLSQLDHIPTKVISYRGETKESLREIQNTASAKLDKKKEDLIEDIKSKHESGNFFQLWGTIFYGGVGGIMPYDLTNNPEIGKIGGTIIAVSAVAGSTAYWLKRRRELKNNIKNINESIIKFGNTPVDKFEVEKDEELADIFNAIEKNEPLKITKPIGEEDMNAINAIIEEIGGSVSPFPTEIYQQKLATYQAPPKKSLFNFSFNLRKRFKGT